jgi:hypothetical protein
VPDKVNAATIAQHEAAVARQKRVVQRLTAIGANVAPASAVLKSLGRRWPHCSENQTRTLPSSGPITGIIREVVSVYRRERRDCPAHGRRTRRLRMSS